MIRKKSGYNLGEYSLVPTSLLGKSRFENINFPIGGSYPIYTTVCGKNKQFLKPLSRSRNALAHAVLNAAISELSTRNVVRWSRDHFIFQQPIRCVNNSQRTNQNEEFQIPACMRTYEFLEAGNNLLFFMRHCYFQFLRFHFLCFL